MTHIHWVVRQNKVVQLTPKPTLKAEALTRVPPTIALCREEDATLRKWSLPRYYYTRCILETKKKVGRTTEKAPDPRTHPNIDESPIEPVLFIMNKKARGKEKTYI